MAGMTPLAMSLVGFACILVGAVVGIFIRHRLPDQHLTGDTKDIVRQGTALIATLASLVLGLLIASANGRDETQTSHIKQLVAHVILLDNTLALFGPDADAVRALLRRDVNLAADRIWS